MGHHRTLPPLVGRDEDLARLESLALGAGGRVVVSGDAGIGKTRLLAELADRAGRSGWRVLTGHCVGEAGASLPYLPFAEVLAQIGEQGELLDAALTAGPEVASLLPGPSAAEAAPTVSPPGASPVGTRSRTARQDPERVDRTRLYAAVHAALEVIATHGPVLVLLEDVHWADESSRDLMTLLLTRGFRGPVGIVITYRSDDLHRRHPLSSTVAVWSRTAGLHRIHLSALPDGAVVDLVRDLGRADLTESQIAEVVRQAEGNAFFAEELAAAAGRSRTAGATDLTRLLLMRVEALPESDHPVVRLAAAAGRRVNHALLARVSGLDDVDLDTTLRRAIERNVLTTAGRDGYVFRHALLAESVYDDLLPGERLRAHRAYVEALLAEPALGTSADLARHAAAVGEHDVAGHASVDAGEAALRVGGPAEALRHFELALSVLTDEDELDSVTLAAARAATGVGHLDRARALLRARMTGRDSLPADTRAQLLGQLAFVARLTESDGSGRELIDEGLSMPGLDGRTRAGLLGLRAEVLLEEDADEAAAQVADEAMRLAVALDMRELQSDLNGVIARLSERGGDPQASLRRLESVVSTWGETTDLALLRAMHQLGGLHYRQGRLQESMATYLRAADRARTVGLQWAPYGLDARAMAATVAYELGEWELTLRVTDHRSESAPAPQAAALDATRMYVRAGRGDVPPEEDYARIRTHWSFDGLIAIQSGSAMVDLYGHAGDLDAAGRVHEDLVTFIRRHWRQPQVMAEVRFAALLTGHRADRAGRLPAAALSHVAAETDRLVEEALSVWQRCGCPPGLEGRAWDARLRAERHRLRWLGSLPGVDPVELLATWQEATRLFRERGEPYEWARSRVRLAAVEAAEGQEAGARVGLAEVRSVAERLGARPLLAEVAAVRERLQGERAAAHVHGRETHLTPRETEVLRLLDAGRSNGQIGAALFISTKTASVHVSNILAKLGAASRGEAVAIARDRGLLGS